MPQIARLNNKRVIISIEDCTEEEWITSEQDKTVQLPYNHDMHDMLRSYKYNFNQDRFDPIIVMGQSGPAAMDLTDAIIEAIVLIAENTETPLSPALLDALGKGKKNR